MQLYSLVTVFEMEFYTGKDEKIKKEYKMKKIFLMKQEYEQNREGQNRNANRDDEGDMGR